MAGVSILFYMPAFYSISIFNKCQMVL